MTQAAILAASGSPGTTTGFKNRIINGGMAIDQRNAGASQTPGGAGSSFIVDRFLYHNSQGSKGTIGQNLNSVTPPVGFTNYIGFQSSSAYSVSATDYFAIEQRLEGFNTYDLGFGTANAKTVTLSFWVYSSLTGTFGGSLQNYAGSRSYPFTYTISSANTWTQIAITIPGDTSGTWVGASNAGSFELNFSLGMGSNYTGAAGAWASANYLNASGSVSVVGTNGATFYITGVQLEVGTTATNFDFRSYTTELQLCQRYYEKSFDIGTAPANGVVDRTCGTHTNYSSGGSGFTGVIPFKVNKRTDPTMTYYATSLVGGITSGQLCYYNGSWVSASSTQTQRVSENCFSIFATCGSSYGGSGYSNCWFGEWVASAEL